jgi:hypothetical protein
LDKRLAGEIVAKASIVQAFGEQVKLAEQLRSIATTGIVLVLVGAGIQLLALFVSLT